MSYFNTTDGLATGTYTVTSSNDLLSEIFTGTNLLGMDFLISFILIFICIIFITRSTSKWLDILAPVSVTWSVLALNVPVWIVVPIALVWTINQIGIKNVSKVLDATVKTTQKVAFDISPKLTGINAKTRITKNKYLEAKKYEMLDSSKRYLKNRKDLNLGAKANKFNSILDFEDHLTELNKKNYEKQKELREEKKRKEMIDRDWRKKVNKNFERELLSSYDALSKNSMRRDRFYKSNLSKKRVDKLKDAFSNLEVYGNEIEDLKKWKPKTSRNDKLIDLKKWKPKHKRNDRRNEEYFKRWKL